MKKAFILTACVLLFGGGLVCWHITAQPWDSGLGSGLGVIVFDEPKEAPTPLLDRKLEERSERELLELKVATYQRLASNVSAHVAVGSPAGSVILLADAHANVAAAEIELYRHIGDQNRLRIALKSRVEALTDKYQAVLLAYEVQKIPFQVFCETEVQLLDAVLEQKRLLASLNEK